jgi:hypothetical protein
MKAIFAELTFSEMPSRRGSSNNIAADLISEMARLGESPLGCMDAAGLLHEVELLAACTPRIQVPAACAANETLRAIPWLMRGRSRRWRFRLLRHYLRSMQGDVRRKLACRADESVVCGRWSSYVALKLSLQRFHLYRGLLTVLGFAFVLRIPVRFEPVCARLTAFLED